jgi:mycothiol synthase
MAELDLRLTPALDPSAVREVRALAIAAEQNDQVEPLGEDTLLALDSPDRRHLVARTGAGLVGYGQLDPSQHGAELTVHPDHRGRGVGRALLERLLEQLQPLRVWAHGTLPAAAALAAALDLTVSRRLLRMATTGSGSLSQPQLPAGLRLRAFLPGADEDEVLAVNARAFTELPDQGGWTRADLDRRTAESWFDPAGFLLAVDEANRIVGFHWTKTHRESSPAAGEVYVVGVDPSQQGRGLGRALTLAGMHHLQQRGLRRILLYVDDANRSAVALYRSLGFETERTDTEYRHDVR